MWYLAFYILSSTAFHQLFRFAQNRNCHVITTAAINYAVAFVLTAVWFSFRIGDVGDHSASLVSWGVANGVLYFVHLLIILAAYEVAGVGVTVALVATSSLVPVLFAWAVWHEPIGGAQWCATFLLPAAMFLMRPGPNHVSKAPHLTVYGDLVLVLVFALGAVVVTIHKGIDVLTRGDDQPLYNVSLFAAAAASSLGYMFIRRLPGSRTDLIVGTAIGSCNTFNLIFLLLSLSILPTAIFYPVAISLVISLNVLLSRLCWNERLRRRQFVGISLAIAIVCLTNLQG